MENSIQILLHIYEPKFGVSTDNSLTNSNKEKVTDNNTNNN